jgi:hypothetical protein
MAYAHLQRGEIVLARKVLSDARKSGLDDMRLSAGDKALLKNLEERTKRQAA